MPGTHRCGRIDHVMVGSQQGADLERVELLKQRFPVTPVELNQGYYLNGLCLDLLMLELSAYVSEITKIDRKSTRLNSSHPSRSRMPSSA